MKSTRFMIETCGLAGLLLNNEDYQPDNRIFTLLEGEEIRIRSQPTQSYLYLLRGEVTITHHEQTTTLKENTHTTPRTLEMPTDNQCINLQAKKDSVIYCIDSKRLDDIYTWVGIAQVLKNEPEKLGILSSVLNTKSLTNLPVESVYELISRMQAQSFNAGDTVVKQGDKAEHFYIIQKGKAEVWSLGLYDDKPQMINILQEGDSFGEDALVTGGTRNATIKMQTDGILLVGNQQDFNDLIAAPSIEEIDADIVNTMKDKDEYQLLDVRYEEEHEENFINGSILLPLHELRDRIDELDQDKKYITYCRSGKRSAVAALILKRKKLNTVSMRGGINQWPYATENLY